MVISRSNKRSSPEKNLKKYFETGEDKENIKARVVILEI